MKEYELRDQLWDRIRVNGSQKRVAEDLGISAQYLNDVLRGRRDISPELAERLGYRRIVTFEKRVKEEVNV